MADDDSLDVEALQWLRSILIAENRRDGAANNNAPRRYLARASGPLSRIPFRAIAEFHANRRSNAPVNPLRPTLSYHDPPSPKPNKLTAKDFPPGKVPPLEDKKAKGLFLFRNEMRSFYYIDPLSRLSHLALAIPQLEKESHFNYLCNNLLVEWAKKKRKVYVPVPQEYYNEIEYFWLILNKLRMMARKFDLDELIDTLVKRFKVDFAGVYNATKGILLTEFHKFISLHKDLRKIEEFFKCDSSYELLESEYLENHKKICSILLDLNMIKHDLSIIPLGETHKVYFMKHLHWIKKRFYVFGCKLDAHMKRSADRTHAIRVASSQHFVEIIIEKQGPQIKEIQESDDQLIADSDSFDRTDSSD